MVEQGWISKTQAIKCGNTEKFQHKVVVSKMDRRGYLTPKEGKEK